MASANPFYKDIWMVYPAVADGAGCKWCISYSPGIEDWMDSSDSSLTASSHYPSHFTASSYFQMCQLPPRRFTWARRNDFCRPIVLTKEEISRTNHLPGIYWRGCSVAGGGMLAACSWVYIHLSYISRGVSDIPIVRYLRGNWEFWFKQPHGSMVKVHWWIYGRTNR